MHELGVWVEVTTLVIPGENSYCPACGAELIKRIGFRIVENLLSDGKCSKCGEAIGGVWV